MIISSTEYQEYEEDYMGYCSSCDDITTSHVEPDADRYTCEECGQDTVKGLMNALIDGNLTID